MDEDHLERIKSLVLIGYAEATRFVPATEVPNREYVDSFKLGRVIGALEELMKELGITQKEEKEHE